MNSNYQKSYRPNKREAEQSQFQVQSELDNSLSHENSDCVRRDKIQRMKKRKKRMYNSKEKGNWELYQDKKFMEFMIENRQSFEIKQFRRSNKIFKKMAKQVESRCPEQCRSHHQKYEKKCKTFDKIIEFIKGKLEKGCYVKSRSSESGQKGQQNGQNQQKGQKSDRCMKEEKQKKKQKATKDPPSFQLIQQDPDTGFQMLINNQRKLNIKIVLNIQSLLIY